MTDANQPKPNPLPAILVYGTPSGPALTQASWFRAEDKEAVKAAAEALKFSVIELQTDADRALAAGAHEGVLKGSGRMIVGSVSAEVYRRIEEHVRKGAGADEPIQAGERRSAGGEIPVRTKQELHPGPGPLRDPTDPTSPVRPIPGRRCGSARGFWPPIGTKSASSRASGSPPSSGSKTASSPSSGSKSPEYPAFKSRAEECRRSRTRSSASRASSAGE